MKQKQIDSEAQHRRMLQTPIPKLVLSLALPNVATQLITVLYNTADTYFVAQLNTSAAAAVGVVFSLMSIIQACGYGIGMGANSLISRKLGEKDNEAANRFASSALLAAVVVGLLLSAGGLSSLQNLMRLLGATETMLPYACDYAFYILLGAPVMCPSFILTCVLRAEGEGNLAMWGLCIGGVLNIFLDPLLIFTLQMGIGGAALATILSQAVSCGILLSYFLRKKSIVKLGARFLSKKPGDYWRICRNGFPTICRQGMASVASALLNIGAAVYGDAAVAAVTISNKVYLLVRDIILGIGQGFQPVAGYNFGAGDKKRVKQAFWYACALGTIVCTAFGVFLLFGAGAVISWFRDDPEVIRIGTAALHFASAVMPFMAYSTYVNQTYQCLGFSGGATFLACCRQGVFFIPLILLLPRAFGLSGIEAAQPTADFLTFLASIPFQIVFFKKILGRAAPLATEGAEG